MVLVDPQTKQQSTTGAHVEGGGIVLQMFVFGAFTVMTTRFHMLATAWEKRGEFSKSPKHWKQLSLAVVATAALLTFRQAYEVVSIDQKTVPMSYAIVQEWVFWFFDQLPLLGKSLLLSTSRY